MPVWGGAGAGERTSSWCTIGPEADMNQGFEKSLKERLYGTTSVNFGGWDEAKGRKRPG